MPSMSELRGKLRHIEWLKGGLALLLPLLLLTGCARISATIQGYSPADPEAPIQVQAGEPVTVSVTVANTGNRARAFLVEAKVFNVMNVEVQKFSTRMDPPLAPQEARSVSWTFVPDTEGPYFLQFYVYKDEGALLAQAPELPERLIVVAAPAETPTVAAKFEPGERVRVMENLNVRQGPSIAQPEVEDPDYPGYMPTGSLGNVIEGPVQADGYTWWKVEFDRGVTGWCVEDGIESLDVLLGRK